MTDSLSFTVYGIPGTAGNKTAFPFRRKDGSMGVAVREGKKAGLAQVWRQQVVSVVQAIAERGGPLIDEPVTLQVTFWLPKPKSAPKTRVIYPSKKPDIDKLVRALLDPMTGTILTDDSRVVVLMAKKRYAGDNDPDGRPRADVLLSPYDPSPNVYG